MKELLKHDVGVLCATTGFGKTVVGAKIISELTDKIEEDEEERYYYLPSSYVFHDSELIEDIYSKSIFKEEFAWQMELIETFKNLLK